jgi:aryl-alcohol dehydrogenase-like predicted oxidoreductase
LAAGFLTGKYRNPQDVKGKARAGVVGKYMNPRGLEVLRMLDEVSARLQSNPARVALAWLMARPSITAPIASATSVHQLEDLLESTKLRLDNGSIETLNRASAGKIAA